MKRLPDGGWPAEERLYTVSKDYASGTDRISWGMVSKTRMNEWVMADAHYVPKAAGRWASERSRMPTADRTK